MKLDIDTGMLSVVKTSKDQLVLTFQVSRPSINYTVGQPYTLGEPLFERMVNRRKRGQQTAVHSMNASQTGQQKARQRGRPSNKERIQRYVAVHGGSAEHAARVLDIKEH
jgi:hypothetical protein